MALSARMDAVHATPRLHNEPLQLRSVNNKPILSCCGTFQICTCFTRTWVMGKTVLGQAHGDYADPHHRTFEHYWQRVYSHFQNVDTLSARPGRFGAGCRHHGSPLFFGYLPLASPHVKLLPSRASSVGWTQPPTGNRTRTPLKQPQTTGT